MNGNTIYDLREEHRKQVRAARRGWPAVNDRPKCLGCGRRLSPDWEYASQRPNNDERSPETDELRGWEAYGNVFCTQKCALSYALATPAARAARHANDIRTEELRRQRTPKFPAT